MKISEIVHSLEKLKSEFGDLDVRGWDDSLPVLIGIVEVCHPTSGSPYVMVRRTENQTDLLTTAQCLPTIERISPCWTAFGARRKTPE